MKVYLAGPISGKTYDVANYWREYATRVLEAAGITALSPMRGKEYLREQGRLGGHRGEYSALSALSTPAGVLARDHWDCMRADVILANLIGAEEISIGTVMEIAWAHAYRKPLVLILGPNNPHEHMMVTEVASFRAASLEEGLRLIQALKARGE